MVFTPDSLILPLSAVSMVSVKAGDMTRLTNWTSLRLPTHLMPRAMAEQKPREETH